MPNFQKHNTKPVSRNRKKMQPQMQSVKSGSQQGLLNNGDVGLYGNPHLTYYLARCVIGNVGEIYTNSFKSIGVIKAVAPNGNFGLKYVRTINNDSADGTYHLEEDKIIALADITKIIVKNVHSGDCQKDENISSEINDDSDITLQHYFNPNEDAETFNLNSGENFTPEEMFEVNAKCFNVTSSYQPNLEGYTLPLDKTDPQYKAKEMYYAKIAAEIEDKAAGSGLDNIIDEDIENNEELQFSAVLQDGIAGRDLKGFNRNKRAPRDKNRASFQKDLCDVQRYGDGSTRYVKSVASIEGIKSSNEKINETKQSVKISSSAEKNMHKDIKNSVSEEKSVSVADASTGVSKSESCDNSKVSPESSKKEEPKKFVLDPDAPEFKPSGLFTSIDQPPLPQQAVPPASFPFVPTGFPQCHQLPVAAFQAPAQPHMLNGNVNTQSAPFCISSTLPYVVHSGLPSTLRPQTQLGFNPQLTVISQSVTGPQPIASTSVPKTSVRSNLPGGYSRQRSNDQLNGGTQQMQYPIFPPQYGNQFYAGASPHIQFIANAPAGLHSSPHTSLTTIPSTVTASQPSGQPLNTTHLTPQSVQMQLAQPSSQPVPSMTQGQNQASQFNPCFPHPQAAYAAQYSNSQLVTSQASGMPGALGFYPSLYQAPGLIPIPIPQSQVNASGQPIPQQPNPSFQHPNQSSIGLSQTPIQLQQPQGVNVPVQQAQQQVLLPNPPYQVQPPLLNPQFLQSNVPLQMLLTLQNSQSIPSHLVPMFMNQQPNGTGV